MSFEYAMKGVFSIKSDIYSFGVLMLEIVCSRKNNSFYNNEHALNLVGYVRILYIYIYIYIYKTLDHIYFYSFVFPKF